MTIRNILSECLERSIRKNLDESLNNFNGYLYHNTTTENLISMMKTDSMRSDYHMGYKDEDVQNGICFTRNKKYNPYTYYGVLLVFNTNDIMRNVRGLRLIPYQDSRFKGLDEYEERLISRNGKPFELKNLSNLVTTVYIVLDSIGNEIIENGDETCWDIDILNEIIENNIFGDKLQFIDNLNNTNAIPYNEVTDYLERYCNEDEEEDEKGRYYIIEYYDEDSDGYNYLDYTSNRDEAIEDAKGYFDEEGVPTRVVLANYSGSDYEVLGTVMEFGDPYNEEALE